MRKRLIAVSLMCGALLSLNACGNYSIPDSMPPPSQAVAANPFDEVEEDAGFLGMLSPLCHGQIIRGLHPSQSLCDYAVQTPGSRSTRHLHHRRQPPTSSAP